MLEGTGGPMRSREVGRADKVRSCLSKEGGRASLARGERTCELSGRGQILLVSFLTIPIPIYLTAAPIKLDLFLSICSSFVAVF